MKSLLAILGFESVLGLLLFGTAGRLDLPWFWALLAAHSLMMLVGLNIIDPGLKKERLRPGGPGLDRGFRPMLLILALAHLVIAGLDAGRFGWSPAIPASARGAALVVYVAGFGLSLWAIWANRFFSPVIRLQTERGHHLIRGGPYAYIRHPGYVGLLLCLSSEAIVLGSLWSLLPVLPFALTVIRRTLLEDRFLRDNLTGYADYALAVRYRMAPGVW